MPVVPLDNIIGPSPTLDSDFIFEAKYNQVFYEVELWLDNSGGESIQQRRPINPNSIVNLTIGDTLANWATVGTLTLMHAPESKAGQTSNVFGQVIQDTTRNYSFRSDGLDLLRIRMIPKINPSNGRSYSSESDKKFWTLSYLFSIYDSEEIDLPQGAKNAAGTTIKALKLYFWDCWYQRLKTRVIQYSTSKSTAKEIDPNLDNGTQGVVYTGQAIKEIIDIGLSEGGVQNSLGSPIDTSIGGGLGFNYSPTASIGLDFDRGAAKIFYTSPAYATAYDSLMYIYNKHVSDARESSSSGPQPPRGGRPFSNQVFDFSLLIKEKGPTEKDVGRLMLKPISSFFQKAGKTQFEPKEYQIEHFFIQSYGSDAPGKLYKAPKNDGTSNTIDITSPAYSYIQNYRFVDIAAITNSQEFCNRPVYSFDFKNRTYNIEYENNKVTTARKFIADKYISELYSSGGGEDLFLINLEEEKRDLNFKPTFSNDGDNPDIRQSAGLQKLLKIGVFQNACINFRTLGLPFREAGRFIGIDKFEGVESGEFEDKFYGQWFIIDIKHVFESEIYYNDITAIKIHRFAPSQLNLGTI